MGSGQVHPAILTMTWVWVLYCLNGKCTQDVSGKSKQWSGGSKKDQEVYTTNTIASDDTRISQFVACTLIEVAASTTDGECQM